MRCVPSERSATTDVVRQPDVLLVGEHLSVNFQVLPATHLLPAVEEQGIQAALAHRERAGEGVGRALFTHRALRAGCLHAVRLAFTLEGL